MSGQEGLLLALYAACLLIRVCRTFSGETAVYFSNRALHASPADETPYKTLYGKDANLGHLRAIGARAFVHVETHIKKLEHRAWEGRLVGYSMDSKSFRIYNASTRSVRESRNVIFIETPSVLPEPDLVSDLDEGEFTYDEYDDMVRDVRNYTSNLDLASPPAADGVVGDPSVRDLLEQIRATTTRDLGLNPASLVPSEHPPVGHSPIASAGGVRSASPEGGNPSGTGGRSDSHGRSGG